MTTDPFPKWRIERIFSAVESMETSLTMLADKQSTDYSTFKSDIESRDIVERRFVKLTEAALDVARVIVRFETGTRPESNPEAVR